MSVVNGSGSTEILLRSVENQGELLQCVISDTDTDNTETLPHVNSEVSTDRVNSVSPK